MSELEIDVSVEFHDDETISIAFKRVSFDDVAEIFTEEFGDKFAAGLLQAARSKSSG